MKIEKITLYTSVTWRDSAIDGIMAPAVTEALEQVGVMVLDHADEELLETNPREKAPDFLLDREEK